jgi:glycosyltransferase involved in cell wall biosynthesis
MVALRIAVLVDRITPGATPKFLGREVKHLRELGYDAEAVSIMDTGLPEGHHQFDEYLADIPVRYISQEHTFLKKLDFTIPPFSFLSAFDVAAGYTMARILKNDPKPYDVIVAHASITCWIANKIWRSLGIPYLAVMWDPISFILDDVYKKKLPGPVFSAAMRLGRRMDRRLIDDSLVSATGAIPYQQIVEDYTGRKIEVLYPGVDISETIPDRRGDFLFTIDRWDIGNMPTWLLEVVAGLSQPVKFKVAGFWWPPEQEEEFMRTVRDLGLEDQVEVLGSVSEEQLISLYRDARAMIFPHKAGINFAVMEAAGQGCPVVMQEGIDIFTHGIDGFFPHPGVAEAGAPQPGGTHRPPDLSGFIECTDKYVTDERLAWEMGERAWTLMKSYSWRAHAQRIAGLIEDRLVSVKST